MVKAAQNQRAADERAANAAYAAEQREFLAAMDDKERREKADLRETRDRYVADLNAKKVVEAERRQASKEAQFGGIGRGFIDGFGVSWR